MTAPAAHTPEQRAAAADLLGAPSMSPRYWVECVKTGRFWDRGLCSDAVVHRMARLLGLKDWTMERIA